MRQCVHSRVGDGYVDVSSTFTNDSEESVHWIDLDSCNSNVLAVHFNNRDVVVLAIPTKIVDPVSKVVRGVSDNDVWSGGGSASELADDSDVGSASCFVGKWGNVPTRAVRQRDLNGCGEVQPEGRG